MEPPDFGRSLNPTSTKGGRLCPPNNAGTSGFSYLPTALLIQVHVRAASVLRQMGLVAVHRVLLLFEAGGLFGLFGLFGLYGSYAVDVHINSEDVEKLLQLEWRLLDHATGQLISETDFVLLI